MDDKTANQIVFVLLLIIIVGIVFTLQLIVQEPIMNKLKNSAGQLSALNIVMMFLVFVGLFLLWRHLTKSRVYHRNPQAW
jgi:uncharacterized membrane protein YhaH (DUF805 family)